MNPSDDELGEELEMLSSHSTPRRSHAHTRLRRRVTTHCGITLLFSIAGIAIVGYLFWPGPPLPRPPIEPNTGIPLPRPPIEPNTDVLSPSHDPIWPNRAVSVKDAFLHAYGGYEKYTTFPDDELRPISNSGQRKCVDVPSTVDVNLRVAL